MVGGWIIEVMSIRPGVSRLWCVDRDGNECAVDVKETAAMPLPSDEVWWQAGKVYWDSDRRELEKVGNSYTPGAEE